MIKYLYTLFVIVLLVSCKKDENHQTIFIEDKDQVNIIKDYLPFTSIQLNNLSSFKPAKSNWQIVGDVTADRNDRVNINKTNGIGVLLNLPTEKSHDNLFSNFEHGDIELELDVMMPKNSNSGIYFQSRYEIQLFDSWGVETPKHSDMAGIYQRWNKEAAKGEEGYEGHAPKVNAAKAPGLWQHLKIKFHAPKFDSKGNKIKNASFEEVRLNGMLLHENIELTGPTRASAFGDEKAQGPLMIQGDHGPVAFKNIRYKLYEDISIKIEESAVKIYDNSHKISEIDTLENFKLLRESTTDSISPLMLVGKNDQKIVSYEGTINIPTSGDYLFKGMVNGGFYFLIDNDTILNMNGDFDMNTSKTAVVNLEAGSRAYQLLYNKPFPWRNGFDIFVEGPNMQRYSFLKSGSSTLSQRDPLDPITIEVTDKPLTQRSFIDHEGTKRSHAISVGLIEKLNYSLDLETGSLLHLWSGDFLETTQMWHSRGEHQKGEPMGFSITSHGDLDFAPLENEDSLWPKTLSETIKFKPLGYEFKQLGLPFFSFIIEDAKISQTFKASKNVTRGLERIIDINTKGKIWHKIADGEHIKALPNNVYIINNESYYIVFSENSSAKPIIRRTPQKEELLIEIPKGNSKIVYSIIW